MPCGVLAREISGQIVVPLDGGSDMLTWRDLFLRVVTGLLLNDTHNIARHGQLLVQLSSIFDEWFLRPHSHVIVENTCSILRMG